MKKETNPLGKALAALPLWAKLLLCLVDFVYSIERIIECYKAKNTLALVVSVVWLFIYPVNLICDLLVILMSGKWISILSLIGMVGDDEEKKDDAIDVEVHEKEGK